MADSEFVFVGYLVQERYVRNWWKREGKRLASLENTVHPSLENPQWRSVGGVLNVTEFLLTPPDMSNWLGPMRLFHRKRSYPETACPTAGSTEGENSRAPQI